MAKEGKEGNEGRKYLKAKKVIDATGEEEMIVITDEPEGFQLDGSAEGGKETTGKSAPPAPAQVYHGRGREEFRRYNDETWAVQTIKVQFEKVLEHQTKKIDVPSLFKHTTHKLFQAGT